MNPDLIHFQEQKSTQRASFRDPCASDLWGSFRGGHPGSKPWVRWWNPVNNKLVHADIHDPKAWMSITPGLRHLDLRDSNNEDSNRAIRFVARNSFVWVVSKELAHTLGQILGCDSKKPLHAIRKSPSIRFEPCDF